MTGNVDIIWLTDQLNKLLQVKRIARAALGQAAEGGARERVIKAAEAITDAAATVVSCEQIPSALFHELYDAVRAIRATLGSDGDVSRETVVPSRATKGE